MPSEKVLLEEDYVDLVSRDVEVPFGNLIRRDEVFGWKRKAEDSVVVFFVPCFKRAYLGVREMIVPGYGIV